MRLVFDLFACQTGSRLRGIGRYTHSLLDAMVRLRQSHRVIAMADGTSPYRASADQLRQDCATLMPAGDFVCYTTPAPSYFGSDSDCHEQVAGSLIHAAWRTVNPDAVLSNPLEGWCESGTTPQPCGYGSALQVALVYDFIPMLFPEHYLTDPAYRQWYMHRLDALGRFDLLLAISEATRQDAIRILGIDPARVVNISGAVSPHFRPVATLPPAHFGITRPYVLYTGNADYRKNLDGMLAAYALLPATLRASHQLVLNQVGSLAALRSKARALGLHEDDVIVTGHISDADLIALYSHCKLFVFPSLGEGFGLPILEAMSCGAPVLAGDNSSMPELVGRADMLFDASDPAKVCAPMQRALTDHAWRSEIAAYGVSRACAFNWDRCATLAWAALEQCTPQVAIAPRRRIACVANLADPSLASTRHCLAVLPLLRQYVDIDLFDAAIEQVDPAVPNLPVTEVSTSAAWPTHALATLLDRRLDYDTVVWQFDDRPSHAFMLPLMQSWAGVTVLHDVYCDRALTAPGDEDEAGANAVLHAEILHQRGLSGLLKWFALPDRLPLVTNGVTLAGTAADCADTAARVPDYLRAIESAAKNDQSHTFNQLAKILQASHNRAPLLDAIANHVAANDQLCRKPRLLLDVTQLARIDSSSGIQRVVKSIARAIATRQPRLCDLELVRLKGGQLTRASEVIGAIFDIDPRAVPKQILAIHPGDTLLMIDSSWEQYAEFATVFDTVRRRGGSIVTVVYDLIPLQRPEFFDAPLVAVFERWFALAIAQSDTLLCISRSVANEVQQYIATNGLVAPRRLQVKSWPLGADLPVFGQQSAVRSEVTALVDDTSSPFFLMVGTVEPRKNHAFVLDAFELLWSNGTRVRLVIAGQAGWRVEELMTRIRGHREYGRQLFFIEKFTDAEIALCYQATIALIAASIAEGFGLPIVEAALHGVPVIASDIAVFREVAGEAGRFFSLATPQALVEAIRQVLEEASSMPVQHLAHSHTLTWDESAVALLDAIGNGGQPHQ